MLAIVVLKLGPFHRSLPGPVERCVVYRLGLQFKYAVPHCDIHGLAELFGFLVQREQD